jgi:hypothetical protein
LFAYERQGSTCVWRLPDRPLEPLGVANTKESLHLIGWSPQVSLTEDCVEQLNGIGVTEIEPDVIDKYVRRAQSTAV